MFILFILLIIIFFFNKSPFISNQNIYIVSFAHNCCKLAQDNLKKSALKYGATKVYNLNLDTLEAPPDVKKYIKNNKRGAGYWIWKPYCLQQIINISNKEDVVIYVDAGTYFNKKIDINDINKNNILCFKHGSIGYTNQSKWTKMNATKYFNYPDNWCETEGKKDQFIASFVGIKNNEFGKIFINRWLESLKNHKLFDDSESDIPNCKDFKESRHDQQMLSLILYKYYSNIDFPNYNIKKYGFVRHENINGKNRNL